MGEVSERGSQAVRESMLIETAELLNRFLSRSQRGREGSIREETISGGGG